MSRCSVKHDGTAGFLDGLNPILSAKRSLCGYLLLWLAMASMAAAVQRFPPPQFSEPRDLPETTTPMPRMTTLEIVDVAVLAGALALGTYLILKKRSRGWIVALVVF